MGLLVAGTPLKWEDALEWLDFVRQHGIEQFLHKYDRVKDIREDVLKWGDETEVLLSRTRTTVSHPRRSIRTFCDLRRVEANDKL